MKHLILLLIISCSPFASLFAADGFPEGTFVGKGIKQFDSGKRVPYKLEMNMKRSSIAFIYYFPEKEPIKFSLKMDFEKHGFFKIGSIGEGYCGDSSCFWSVKLAPEVVESWTMVFSGKKISKTGSLVSPKSKNWWEEELILQ